MNGVATASIIAGVTGQAPGKAISLRPALGFASPLIRSNRFNESKWDLSLTFLKSGVAPLSICLWVHLDAPNMQYKNNKVPKVHELLLMECEREGERERERERQVVL